MVAINKYDGHKPVEEESTAYPPVDENSEKPNGSGAEVENEPRLCPGEEPCPHLPVTDYGDVPVYTTMSLNNSAQSYADWYPAGGDGLVSSSGVGTGNSEGKSNDKDASHDKDAKDRDCEITGGRGELEVAARAGSDGWSIEVSAKGVADISCDKGDKGSKGDRGESSGNDSGSDHDGWR